MCKNTAKLLRFFKSNQKYQNWMRGRPGRDRARELLTGLLCRCFRIHTGTDTVNTFSLIAARLTFKYSTVSQQQQSRAAKRRAHHDFNARTAEIETPKEMRTEDV